MFLLYGFWQWNGAYSISFVMQFRLPVFKYFIPPSLKLYRTVLCFKLHCQITVYWIIEGFCDTAAILIGRLQFDFDHYTFYLSVSLSNHLNSNAKSAFSMHVLLIFIWDQVIINGLPVDHYQKAGSHSLFEGAVKALAWIKWGKVRRF